MMPEYGILIGIVAVVASLIDDVVSLILGGSQHAAPYDDTSFYLQLIGNRNPANSNPWYQLISSLGSDREQRRFQWNRLVAGLLTQEQRQRLDRLNRFSAAELVPYPQAEIHKRIVSLKSSDETRAAAAILANWGREKYLTMDLSRLFIDDDFDLTDFIFPTPITFHGSELKRSIFDRAIFLSTAQFDAALFRRWGNFKEAIFFETATFDNARFIYNETNSFVAATFFGNARFVGAVFGPASFAGATFEGEVDFTDAVFNSDVNFVNATFKNVTRFEKSKFRRFPPRFDGAKMHQGTHWFGAEWPPLPSRGDLTTAAAFVGAYQRLKLEMDGVKRHDDELFFFAKELQSRQALLGWRKGLPIALYGWLCGFGRDFARPLYWLGLVILIGFAYFMMCPVDVYDWSAWNAAGLSLANTTSLFGFRKEFISEQVLAALTGPQRILSAMQTVAGLILLFLFGLSTRNYFRMK